MQSAEDFCELLKTILQERASSSDKRKRAVEVLVDESQIKLFCTNKKKHGSEFREGSK